MKSISEILRTKAMMFRTVANFVSPLRDNAKSAGYHAAANSLEEDAKKYEPSGWVIFTRTGGKWVCISTDTQYASYEAAEELIFDALPAGTEYEIVPVKFLERQ